MGLLGYAMLAITACSSIPENDPEAAAEYRKINDPVEKANRFIFKFNQGVDNVVLKPVTGIYRILPKFVRNGFHNFFHNLKTPVILANDILQGEPVRAGNTLTRFVINTTIGIGGVRDQASSWGIGPHSEDFGQTLAVWGVEEGPYLMLPILGPSNPRDAIGKVVDYLVDPITWWARNTDEDWVPITRTVVNAIDTRDRLWDALEGLEKSSIDYYAAVRSLYRQQRNSEIANGKRPMEKKNSDLSGYFDLVKIDDLFVKSDVEPGK
jgi:phospholipid-binding lipoprotein MlaA